MFRTRKCYFSNFWHRFQLYLIQINRGHSLYFRGIFDPVSWHLSHLCIFISIDIFINKWVDCPLPPSCAKTYTAPFAALCKCNNDKKSRHENITVTGVANMWTAIHPSSDLKQRKTEQWVILNCNHFAQVGAKLATVSNLKSCFISADIPFKHIHEKSISVTVRS